MRFIHLPNSPGPVDLSQFPDVEFMGVWLTPNQTKMDETWIYTK